MITISKWRPPAARLLGRLDFNRARTPSCTTLTSLYNLPLTYLPLTLHVDLTYLSREETKRRAQTAGKKPTEGRPKLRQQRGPQRLEGLPCEHLCSTIIHNVLPLHVHVGFASIIMLEHVLARHIMIRALQRSALLTATCAGWEGGSAQAECACRALTHGSIAKATNRASVPLLSAPSTRLSCNPYLGQRNHIWVLEPPVTVAVPFPALGRR